MALKILLGGDMRIHYNGQLRTVREYYLEKIHPGVEYAGIRPVKKLETRVFGEVYVGAEHAVSVDKKSWIKANFTKRKTNKGVIDIPIKYKSDALCRAKDFFVENVKMGILLGLLIGDGSLWTNIRLASGKEDVKDIVNFLSNFNVNYSLYDKKRGNVEIGIYFKDYVTAEFAEKYGLPLMSAFEEKFTPNSIWTNKEYALGYLIGFLASDGTVHPKLGAEIYNANKNLVTDVSILASEYFDTLALMREKNRVNEITSSGIIRKRVEYRVRFGKLNAKKVFCGYEHLVPIKRKREALINLTNTDRSLSEFKYQIKTNYRVSFAGHQDVYAIDANDLFWYRGFWIEPVRV